MTDYWKLRAENYNKIDWVKDTEMLNKLISFCDLNEKHFVLDLGCGTGIVSNLIVDKVLEVMAIDKSKDMLKQGSFHYKIDVWNYDIEVSPLVINYFDRIIARMVFHHIYDVKKTFKYCYQSLDKGGWLIIEEGISPSDDKKVRKWTEEVRNLKEKRNHFTERDLVKYYRRAGFRNVNTQILTRKFSVKNWLANSWKDNEMYQQMWDLHLNAPDYIKKAYNMEITENDIIIETKTLFIKGQKI